MNDKLTFCPALVVYTLRKNAAVAKDSQQNHLGMPGEFLLKIHLQSETLLLFLQLDV